MNCVKIVADDQKSSIEVSGTPLDCFCIMGSVTVKTLAKIIPDMPCRPETAINSFGSTLMEQLRKYLRADPGKEKPQEEGREHVCRCQKKADEASSGEHVCRCREESEKDRKLTLEEIAEMIGKLNAGELNRLGCLIMQRAVDSLAADEKPKEESVKFYPPDGSSLGVF